MKPKFFAVLGLVAVLIACVQPIEPPIKPLLTALVRFEIQSTFGRQLADVNLSVVDTSLTATTNASGKANLTLELEKTFTIKLSKTGFSEQFKVISVPKNNKELLVTAQLLERQAVKTVPRVEQGGQASGKDGVRLELPPAALLNAQGQAVIGEIQVSMTPVNVMTDDIGGFPGRFEGIAQGGSSTPIVSYGTVEFELSQNGQEVQIAPGKTVQIQMPFYASQHPNGTPVKVGDTVPLWSLNEKTGIWTQEGTGTVVVSSQSPTGFALQATVSHFSWWNIDIAPDTAKVRVKCLSNETQFIVATINQSCSLTARVLDGNTPRGVADTNVPIDEFSGELVIPAGNDIRLTVCSIVAIKPSLELRDACGSITVKRNVGTVSDVSIQLELLEEIRLTLNTPTTDQVTDKTVGFSATLESGKPAVVELIAVDLFNLDARIVLKSFTVAPFTFDWDTSTVKQGIYLVAFQAIVPQTGTKIITAVRQITVDRNNPPPIASFTQQFQASQPPFTYSFDPSASQGQGTSIERLEWDFGDGTSIITTDTSPISHRYFSTGVYTVKLAVIDLDGERSQTSQSITVQILESAGGILFERLGVPLAVRNQTTFEAKILNTPFTLNWEVRYSSTHPIPELRGQCVNPINQSGAPVIRPQADDCTITKNPGETFVFDYRPDSPNNIKLLRLNAAIDAYQEPIVITAATPQGFVSQLPITLDIPAVPSINPGSSVDTSCTAPNAAGIEQQIQLFLQFTAPNDWYAMQAQASRDARISASTIKEFGVRTNDLVLSANTMALLDPIKGKGDKTGLSIFCNQVNLSQANPLNLKFLLVTPAATFSIGTQTTLNVSARGDFFLIEPSSYGQPPAFLDNTDSLLIVGGNGMFASLFSPESGSPLTSGGCQTCVSYTVGTRLKLPLNNPEFVIMLRPKVGAGASQVPIIAAVPAAFENLSLPQTISSRLPTGEIPVLLNLNAPQDEWVIVSNSKNVFIEPLGQEWAFGFPSYTNTTSRSWFAAKSNGQVQKIAVKPHTAFSQQNFIALGTDLEIRMSSPIIHVTLGTPISGTLTAPVSNSILGTNTGTLGYAHLYTFDGTSNNKLTIAVPTPPSFVKYVLLRPNGNIVRECLATQTSGNAQCTNIALNLPESGKYALVVHTGGELQGANYNFTLNIAP